MTLHRTTTFTTEPFRDLKTSTPSTWTLRLSPTPHGKIVLELLNAPRTDPSYSLALPSPEFRQLAVALLGPTELPPEAEPGTPAPKHRPTPTDRPRAPGGVEAAITRHFTPQGTFTFKQSKLWMEQAGYQQNSASATLDRIKKRGIIERTNELGRWRFIRDPKTPAPANA